MAAKPHRWLSINEIRLVSLTKKTWPLSTTTPEKSWVNSNLLIKWINSIFPVVDVSDCKCIVWDSFRYHHLKSVKENFQKRNINTVVVPGGCKPYLQSVDIGIFSELKDRLWKIINAWKNSDDVNYTRGGNPIPPTNSVVKLCLRYSWSALSVLNIQNSIKSSGFSVVANYWHVSKRGVKVTQFLEALENCQENEIDPDQMELIGQLYDMAID